MDEPAATSQPGGMNAVVPYVATWSAEERTDPPVVERPSGLGIAYADETPADRDSRGVLWDRFTLRPGQGRPRYAQIHPARQRRAMRKLICQVCGAPADTTDDGVLWLFPAEPDPRPEWPNGATATEPPICLPCLHLSLRVCPALRKGHLAVRAGKFPLHGISGTRYRTARPTPVPLVETTVAFHDPVIHWTLAAKLARELDECAILHA